MTGPRIVVVGGGIAGLAAAYEAQQRGASVTLLEADDRVGGKIETATFAGLPVELGPDMILTRVPWAVDLCRELDLDDALIAPDTNRAWVWARGKVRPMPPGLSLGVPTDLFAVARSGIVSVPGLARAALDVVLPHRPPVGDVSAGSVVRRRFGAEVAERLVDPLLGGINAGTIDHLSIEAAAPQLAAAAREHRSLLLALRRQATAQPVNGGNGNGATGSPVFTSITGGLERLVDALALRLSTADVRLHSRVAALEPATAGGSSVRVVLDHGEAVDADAVVLATPAFAAADAVRGASPAAAADLEAIDHASVAVLLLAYDRAAVPTGLDGSGVVIPRRERRLATAITWYSTKWRSALSAGRAADAGELPVVFRISCGRYHDPRAADLDDTTLVERLLAELREALGVTASPRDARLVRWPRSFPQYLPGHLDRVARIEAALAADLRGVTVAGAAYRGVGIPACIRQGRDAAARLLTPATS